MCSPRAFAERHAARPPAALLTRPIHRHRDLVKFVGARSAALDSSGNRYLQARCFCSAHFETLRDLALPTEWVVTIQHTRSGQGDNRIPGRTADARVAFKKDVLRRVLQKTFAVAPTHGFPILRVLMGDLNLTPNAV
ncbi:MAG: hypothetical protein GY772_02500, partial [bacterium]|nr:hypothetical protein [bacterium]